MSRKYTLHFATLALVQNAGGGGGGGGGGAYTRDATISLAITPSLPVKHDLIVDGGGQALVSSGGAPTPAGTSVFTEHNWDMGMGYLWLNGWGIHHF